MSFLIYTNKKIFLQNMQWAINTTHPVMRMIEMIIREEIMIKSDTIIPDMMKYEYWLEGINDLLFSKPSLSF